MGPYTRQVLTEHRARTSAVHVVTEQERSTDGVTAAERARRLYEQIGTLYAAADAEDTASAVHPHYPDPGEGRTAQELADFLDTVRRALAAPTGPSARALGEALRRYEHDRTGGAA